MGDLRYWFLEERHHRRIFDVTVDHLRAPFPAPDRGADLVVAESVFTRLSEAEVPFHLSECARVVDVGGVVLSTWFFLDACEFPVLESASDRHSLYVDGGEGPLVVDRRWLQSAAKDRGLTITNGFPVVHEVAAGEWYVMMEPEPPRRTELSLDVIDRFYRRFGREAPEHERRARLVARHQRAGHPLEPFEFRVTSDNGEDGVLAELLRRVGASSRFFVEFGAADGRRGNCVLLADSLEWSGVFIEEDRRLAALLHDKYRDVPRVCVVNATVTPDNVEHLFADAGVPAEPDVLSIDVDGNDYWVWRAITRFRPRIVVIEYNHSYGSVEAVQPYDPELSTLAFIHAMHRAAVDLSPMLGASVGAIRTLGAEKGYDLVYTDTTDTNAFLVRRDLAAAANLST